MFVVVGGRIEVQIFGSSQIGAAVSKFQRSLDLVPDTTFLTPVSSQNSMFFNGN